MRMFILNKILLHIVISVVLQVHVPVFLISHDHNCESLQVEIRKKSKILNKIFCLHYCFTSVQHRQDM